MSGIDSGRKLVVSFIEKNNIAHQDLATAYGKERVFVTNALSGKLKGASVNLFILEVIRDYKLRDEKEGEENGKTS
ncbi:hypothetical protein [Listeria booriae]|uniref:hypothetical protein n=1 Tax=Listeria booriae TaxID=1552123 RepID=UPI00162AA921|nr:hypothetical protein [Listeria booriae]MBC2196276.1 hypothetical protein [Listeria booriae]